MDCPNCGATVSPDERQCRKCGSFVERSGGAAYAAAGSDQFTPPPAPILPVIPVKSRSTAMLLAFTLGWAGAHRFYLGYYHYGLVLLLLSVLLSWCTFGLTFVAAVCWGVAEGFMILNGMLTRDADGRPFVD